MPGARLTAAQLIEALGLQPLPVEGGLFRQTYSSADQIDVNALPALYSGISVPGGKKPLGTAIYYLLTNEPDSFSAFHRLLTDEIFHFYLGDPFEMTLLYPDGLSRQIILGQDLLQGQQVQFIAPRGVWQGSRVQPGGEYSLIGTTMAPGYTDSDYEAGERDALLAAYPAEYERIIALTRI